MTDDRDDQIEHAASAALAAVDRDIAAVAEIAAERQLSDRTALAAHTAATARLSVAILGPERAAAELRAAAARIEAHEAERQLAAAEPAGRA